MPEILEIEMYLQGALPVIGRTICKVVAPDDWYLKGVDAIAAEAVLCGASVHGLRRHGKLLMLDTTGGVWGLRFGMTGRLVIDDEPVIDKLEYSSGRLDPSWNRFGIEFGDGGSLVMNDPRRLGGVIFEPAPAALGPDAWLVDSSQLARIVEGRSTKLKALLLDQKRIAGLGNLLVDELLWRAGLAPDRSAGSLTVNDVATLAKRLPEMLDQLFQRGGSHRGDLGPERRGDGHCPVDGEALRHGTVGGRSTWWCPAHQR